MSNIEHGISNDEPPVRYFLALPCLVLLVLMAACWGMRAPAITLPDLSGRTVSTSQFPDAKAIVVVFWAAWSEYAPELLERLERMHRATKDGSLVVVGVNVENQRLGPEEIVAAQ